MEYIERKESYKNLEELRIDLRDLRFINYRKASRLAEMLNKPYPTGFEGSKWDKNVFEFGIISPDKTRFVLIEDFDNKIVRKIADGVECKICAGSLSFPVKFYEDGTEKTVSSILFKEEERIAGVELAKLQIGNKDIISRQVSALVEGFCEERLLKDGGKILEKNRQEYLKVFER